MTKRSWVIFLQPPRFFQKKTLFELTTSWAMSLTTVSQVYTCFQTSQSQTVQDPIFCHPRTTKPELMENLHLFKLTLATKSLGGGGGGRIFWVEKKFEILISASCFCDLNLWRQVFLAAKKVSKLFFIRRQFFAANSIFCFFFGSLSSLVDLNHFVPLVELPSTIFPIHPNYLENVLRAAQRKHSHFVACRPGFESRHSQFSKEVF